MLKEFSAALCAAALLTVITPVTAADTVSQPVVTNEATANETANGSTTSAAQDPVSTQRVLIAVPNSNRQLGLDKTILTDFVTRTKALFPYPAYGTRETNTGLYPTQVTLAKLANDNDADIVVMPAIKNGPSARFVLVWIAMATASSTPKSMPLFLFLCMTKPPISFLK